MPSSRLDVAVGLTERRRRDKAALLFERATPELAFQDLVVAHVGDAARRALFLVEHKAPTHSDDLAVAVDALADHGCDVTRKDG